MKRMLPYFILAFTLGMASPILAAENSILQPSMSDAQKYTKVLGYPDGVVKSVSSVFIVRIEVPTLDIDNPIYQGYGTAFFAIKPGYILTALHLFPRYTEVLNGNQISVSFKIAGKDDPIKAKIIYFNPIFDLMLLSYDLDDLTAAGIQAPAALKLADKLPEVGDPLWTIGYFSDNQLMTIVLKSHFANFYLNAISVESGYVIKPLMILDPGVEKGYSGSPVLNEKGEVVGLLQAISVSGRFGLALPVGAIKHFLEAAKNSGNFKD